MGEGLSQKEAEESAPALRDAREMLRTWEAEDPEVRALWDLMNSWVYDGFELTYERLGISFHKTYYESETYKLGKELILKGLAGKKNYRRTEADGETNV